MTFGAVVAINRWTTCRLLAT